MSFVFFAFSVILGIGSLAFAYSGVGFDGLVRWLLAFGVFWLLAGWQRWTWVSSVGLILIVALAGIGIWFEISPGWMIAGALGGMMAWDMADFMRRLLFAPRSDDLRDLQRRHLTRLFIVAVVGAALASIAMLVRMEFTFTWGVILALLAVLGLTQLGAWLRRGG